MFRTLAPFAALVLFGTGCSFAVRSPDMYRDDTTKALSTKNEDIKACYDGAVKSHPGAAGKVTVKFNVEEKTGKFTDIAVDKANTNAADPIPECVTKAIAGLSITPGDQKKGEASFSYEFTAPAAAAAPAAPAAPTGPNATHLLK